jgi:hypothetical protein
MVFGRHPFSSAHIFQQEYSPDERRMQDIHERYDLEIRGRERQSRAIEKTSWDMQARPHKPVSALDRDFGPQLENGAISRSDGQNSVPTGAATDARFR